jgi:esterase
MQLNYKVFGEGFPLVILHGLLGSLDNWQTLAKKLSEQYKVYIVDQRNHGKSPHSDEFSYDLLSADLLEFLDMHHISKTHLIGHSMGGKTVMQFALKHPERVAKLVVVDITPGAFDDRHSDVFEALHFADAAKAQSRDEVEARLRQKLEEESTVLFLLKGLMRSESGNGFDWKFNLGALHKAYNNISSAIEENGVYEGETLFIKGQKSSYINPANYGDISDRFLHHHLVEIKDAGHWVHAEKPVEFLAAVSDFLSA